MRNVELLVGLLFFIGSGLGCSSKKPDKNLFLKYIYPEFNATIPDAPLSDRYGSHMALRDQNWIRNTSSNEKGKYQCTPMRPGMAVVAHGVNKFFISTHASDVEPTTSRLFDLSCANAVKDDMSYLKPAEIETVHTYKKSHYIQQVHTYDTIQSIIRTQPEINGLWFGLATKSNIQSWKIETDSLLTVVSYTVFDYKVKCNGRLTLTEQLKNDYADLPEDYTDPSAFYRFFQTYGTDWYKDLVMGGRLHMMIKHLNRGEHISVFKSVNTTLLTVQDILNTYSGLVGQGNASKSFLATGGVVYLNDTMDRWRASVHNSPMPVAGTLVPIVYLLDEQPEGSLRSKAFMEARKSEELHHLLKKLFVEMGYEGSLRFFREEQQHPLLLTKTKDLILKEISFVVPRRKVYNVILKAYDSDPTMKKYWVYITEKDIEEEELIVRLTNRFNIFPGVCITPEQPLKQGSSVRWNLPMDHSCIMVYTKADCVGLPNVIRTPEVLSEMIHLLISFQLCKDDRF